MNSIPPEMSHSNDLVESVNGGERMGEVWERQRTEFLRLKQNRRCVMVALIQKRDELAKIKTRLCKLLDEVSARRESIEGQLEEIGLQISSIERDVNSVLVDTEKEIDFEEKHIKEAV